MPASMLPALFAVMLLPGCASNQVIVELSASVMHEKPKIGAISHILIDERLEGGTVKARIRMSGDPGLAATFDISPGVVVRGQMQETEPGRYEGEYSFELEQVGGPFTIIGRLRHEAAGEVTLRDPEPLTIPLTGPRR